MVADRGNDAIHRFDGISGAYLGSFGQGYVQNPMALALDQANNRVFVAEPTNGSNGSVGGSARIWSFNYNTGEYLNSFTTNFLYGIPQIAYRSGFLSVGNDGSIYDRYDVNTGLVVRTSQWPLASAGLAHQGTNLWAFSDNKVYSRDDVTNGLVTTYTMATPVASSTLSGQRQLAISGNRALAVGAISFSGFRLDTLSTSGTNAMVTNSISGYNQMNGAGFGHGDIAYVGGTRSAGGGAISRILWSSGTHLQTLGSGILSEPHGIAVVVAPEPGSLLGMGVAALAFLRRKRNG